jgi:hypothetical protein
MKGSISLCAIIFLFCACTRQNGSPRDFGGRVTRIYKSLAFSADHNQHPVPGGKLTLVDVKPDGSVEMTWNDNFSAQGRPSSELFVIFSGYIGRPMFVLKTSYQKQTAEIEYEVVDERLSN